MHFRRGLWFFGVMVGLALPAWAQMWQMMRETPLPQDELLPANLAKIAEVREDIQQVMVVVQLGNGEENPKWMMSQTDLQVLLNKLMNMPEAPGPEDEIWPKLKDQEPSYRGISLLFQTVEGKRFEPVGVFKGVVKGPKDAFLAPDQGRRLEYWIFGTARVRRDQLLGVHVLPVFTFEQCRLLGQRVVQTSPRQCLLPDNSLMLELSEKATVKSARIKDFDGCLQAGSALIYTFPRRCVAQGGRVFTEPPRVYDARNPPADAPLAQAVSGTVGEGLAVSATVVSVTGLEGGVVSPTAPVSASVPEVPVSADEPLSDIQLRELEPAAGPGLRGKIYRESFPGGWKE